MSSLGLRGAGGCGVSARPVGLHDDVPEAEYHADRNSLSVTGAKLLLKSPAKFRYRLDHPEHKDVFDFGTAAHALVLSVGAPLAVVDADSWRGKAAQEARAEARERGETPILAADYRRVQAMADALSEHEFAMTLLSGGRPEVSAYALDEETGVMRRGRFDYLKERVASDYKSAADVSPDGFARSVVNFGYDMQAAWYSDLADACGHPLDAFAFVAQEKEAPYSVEVYDLPPELLQRGRDRNRRALERYRDCTQSGIWPGYTGQPFTTLPAPRWALREDAA